MSNGNLNNMNNMNNVQNVNGQTANVNSANVHSAGIPAAAIMQAANAQIPSSDATNNAAPQIASPAQAEQQIQSHQLQAVLSQLSTSQLASSQVPETQFSSTPTQLGQSNVIRETPSSIGPATPMSTPSPHSSASPRIAALIGPDIAQVLMQGLTGSSDQNGGKEGRRFPCRSCKAFAHSWLKCPSLNVVNVIISLITSKREQCDRDSNVKRVKEALAKLGVDPTALGVNLERNQGQPQHASPSGGANAQLESAINAALTGSGSTSTMASPTPSPTTHMPQPTVSHQIPIPNQQHSGGVTHPLQSLFSSMGIQSSAPQMQDLAMLVQQPTKVPTPVMPVGVHIPTTTHAPTELSCVPCLPLNPTMGTIQIDPTDPNAADTLRAVLGSLKKPKAVPLRQPQHYKVPVPNPPLIPQVHVISPTRWDAALYGVVRNP